MSAIDISDLTVAFAEGHPVLNGIDIRVEEEEFVALVGPSGSGKTTLLRAIAGFVAPTAGTIKIAGADVTGVAPERRNLGMVFQQHAVWPHMSVSANIAYPLKRRGLARAECEQRVSRALELVGLSDFAERRPDSLSGGQRQRVALARAIVAEPDVLLLDEALSALDEPLRDSLRRELVALSKRQHLTTVHVTHDRLEALAIADRVVVLSEGRIQQHACPQELVTHPATPEVAAFIADATLLEGTASGATLDCPTLGTQWEQGNQAAVGPAIIAVLPQHVSVVAPGT